MGTLELLAFQFDEMRPEEQEHLQVLQTCARAQLSIINDLVDFAEIEKVCVCVCVCVRVCGLYNHLRYDFAEIEMVCVSVSLSLCVYVCVAYNNISDVVLRGYPSSEPFFHLDSAFFRAQVALVLCIYVKLHIFTCLSRAQSLP